MRLSTRAMVERTLWRGLGLVAFHDLLVSGSHLASRSGAGPCAPPCCACHAHDYDDRSFVRNAVGAAAVYRW